jgi:hypothetical protein
MDEDGYVLDEQPADDDNQELEGITPEIIEVVPGTADAGEPDLGEDFWRPYELKRPRPKGHPDE